MPRQLPKPPSLLPPQPTAEEGVALTAEEYLVTPEGGTVAAIPSPVPVDHFTVLADTLTSDFKYPDKLTLHGTIAGYRAEYTMTLGEDQLDDPDFLPQTVLWLAEVGFDPPAPPAARQAQAVQPPPPFLPLAPPPAPVWNPATGAYELPAQSPAGPAPAAAGTQGCPTHGVANARPGYQGRGYECKAYSNTPQPWARTDGVQLRNGQTAYFCKYKW